MPTTGLDPSRPSPKGDGRMAERTRTSTRLPGLAPEAVSPFRATPSLSFTYGPIRSGVVGTLVGVVDGDSNCIYNLNDDA